MSQFLGRVGFLISRSGYLNIRCRARGPAPEVGMMESRWMNRASFSFSIPGVAGYHAHLAAELPCDACGHPPASDGRGGGGLDKEAVGAFGDVDLLDFGDPYELLDGGIDGCVPLWVYQIELAERLCGARIF